MSIDVHVDHRPGGAVFAEQVATVDRLQRGLRKADRAKQKDIISQLTNFHYPDSKMILKMNSLRGSTNRSTYVHT